MSSSVCLALLMSSISHGKKLQYPLRIGFILLIKCGVCVTSTVDLQRQYFPLAFNIPIETSNFGVRGGTRFALNEDEVSNLPAVRRVWTCVREHRRSFGRGIERCSSSCRLEKRYQYGGTFTVHLDGHKMFKCTLYLRQTNTNGVGHRRP